MAVSCVAVMSDIVTEPNVGAESASPTVMLKVSVAESGLVVSESVTL